MKGAFLSQRKDDPILQYNVLSNVVESNQEQQDKNNDFSIEPLKETVGNFVQAWRARASYFPVEVLSETSWSMLVQLFESETKGQRMSVEELCTAAGPVASAAIRWLKVLENHELTTRSVNPEKMINEFIGLSVKGRIALRSYFCDVIQFTNNSSVLS